MIETRTVRDTVILDLPGIFESDKLQGEIQRLFQQNHRKIGINLSNITFIESSGLGALVSVYKFCDANNGTVVFFAVQPYVQQLLELTKLNRVLKIQPTEEEALQALSS
jgi:anti-sigma B factor antagonist